jgi:hypothetical protein
MSNFGQVKLCVFCDNYYDPKAAIGKWVCFYHPESTYYSDRRAKILFRCCDRAEKSTGCSPCDHTTDDEQYESKIKVTFDEFASFKTKPPKSHTIDGEIVYQDTEKKIIDTQKSYVYVKKHD